MNWEPPNRANNKLNLPPRARGPVTPRPLSRQTTSSNPPVQGRPLSSRFNPPQRPAHGPRYGPSHNSNTAPPEKPPVARRAPKTSKLTGMPQANTNGRPSTPHKPGQPQRPTPIHRHSPPQRPSPPNRSGLPQRPSPPNRSGLPQRPSPPNRSGPPQHPRLTTSQRLRLSPSQQARIGSSIKKPSKGPSEQDTSSEQRRYSRMKMIMGMVCRRQGKKDTNVFTDDVSAGGIKFTCSLQLDRGEEVFLDVPIGNGEYKSIPGKIAWVKKTALGGIEGGIEFDRMDNATRREWEKFIDRNAEPD